MSKYHSADTVFSLPPVGIINDKAFKNAIFSVFKPKNSTGVGRPNWLSKINIDHQKYIYELFQSKESLGRVSKHVRVLPWAKSKNKIRNPRVVTFQLGNFGRDLETYFKDVDQQDYEGHTALAVIKDNLSSTPEDYLEPISPKNFPIEYLKSATTLLRNAANLEARIAWLMEHETKGRYTGLGKTFVVESKDITTAQRALHDIHKEIMILLRQNINPSDAGIPGLSAENVASLFIDKDRTDKLVKASTLLVNLLKKQSIPLTKDAKGNYQVLGEKGNGKK